MWPGIKNYIDTAVIGVTSPFIDTTNIIKGSADATKLLRFEVDGFTTGTTRVLTPPNADITLAGVNISNAWSDGITQTFNPNGISAGVNVGGHTADPSVLNNGDVWYQSTANELRARVNGATVSIGLGAPPFIDTTNIIKGSADQTKLLRFEVDGFTTGTTRVLTPPNADITLAGINNAQTFSATQTIAVSDSVGLNIIQTLLSAASVALSVLPIWINSGADLIAVKVNPNNSFSGAGSLLLDLSLSSVNKWKCDKNGAVTQASSLTVSAGGISITSGALTVTSGNVTVTSGTLVMGANAIQFTETTVLRDGAANTLANRNGTNAQDFRVYNTFTSTTNFERLNLGWTTNVCHVWTEKGSGGGTARDLILGADVTELMRFQTGTKLSFFAATPVVKQTSGANLTNNVTAGGTDDTIANYTDLTIYANDAAAIRNDIYQLARKLKQVNDALRTYGLLT